MTSYDNLFRLFPHAKSIALAGIYGIKSEVPEGFKLSDQIYLYSKREEFDILYHPRLSDRINKPDYYLVGVSDDERFITGFRKINQISDALSSITIAHQALCIFHNAPYGLGQIEGFLLGSVGSFGLSDPAISARNVEVDNELFRVPTLSHSFHYPGNKRASFDTQLVEFFTKVCNAYAGNIEKRWLLSALKFTSGINRYYAEDALLDFSVALESLLAMDKEQISFKIRLYLALLIGDSYNERAKIVDDVKKFYSFRSNFVHGNRKNLSDDNIAVIERVGTYLSKALTRTCGVNIEKDLVQELDYMLLIGAPRIARERTKVIISEKEIVDDICRKYNIETIESYRAYLMNTDDPDDKELLIELRVNGETIGPFYASLHIPVPAHKITYWLSQDKNEGYSYCVDYIDEK